MNMATPTQMALEQLEQGRAVYDQKVKAALRIEADRIMKNPRELALAVQDVIFEDLEVWGEFLIEASKKIPGFGWYLTAAAYEAAKESL